MLATLPLTGHLLCFRISRISASVEARIVTIAINQKGEKLRRSPIDHVDGALRTGHGQLADGLVGLHMNG